MDRLGAVIAAALLLAGCWRGASLGGGNPDGGDTAHSGGPTDPDTGAVGEWIVEPVDSPTTHDLSGVWGSSRDAVWAVGEEGTILRFDGQSWMLIEQHIPASPDLYGVAGSGPDRVWAVGGERCILEHDGSAWTSVESAFTPDADDGSYRAVCAVAPETAYAVGDDSTLAAWWGWGFSEGYAMALGVDFHSAACTPEGGLFAAGHAHDAFASSLIVHCSEPWSCNQSQHDSMDNMYGIAADEAGDTWAVGYNEGQGSTLYHYLNGGGWKSEHDSPRELMDLHVDVNLGVWAAGGTGGDDDRGAIQAWRDGAALIETDLDDTPRLRAIWGVSDAQGDRLVAVGKQGAIVHVDWQPI
ncbi:MAG: hypothetical protein R6V85_04595 [Polyangia bacterium]